MNIEKTAMITICGRPNVGKSTLTNALLGEKIAIVSSKPQTTRSRITAIVNRNGCQLVIMDTPGFHKARTRLGDYMVNGKAKGIEAGLRDTADVFRANPPRVDSISGIFRLPSAARRAPSAADSERASAVSQILSADSPSWRASANTAEAPAPKSRMRSS